MFQQVPPVTGSPRKVFICLPILKNKQKKIPQPKQTNKHTQIKTTEILATFCITTETRQNAQNVFWRSEIILSKFNNQSSQCIAITQNAWGVNIATNNTHKDLFLTAVTTFHIPQESINTTNHSFNSKAPIESRSCVI